MDIPLFSIITITFNAEQELEPTMISVTQQVCRDFEHIIVDGASSDGTIALARRIGGNDLRIISEKDMGLYDAMNKGIRLARGKYLIFLNAGDSFASQDTLSLYAEAAKKNPDIIYADTVIVAPDRSVKGPRHLSAPKVLTARSFSNGMLVCHQAFVVKRSISPFYDLQYRFSADYDWTIRCIKSTIPDNCINLDTVAIHYLDDGLTEKHKKASLKERYDIMCRHYGTATAIVKHLSFIPRALIRKFF